MTDASPKNPFEDYAKTAYRVVNAPQKLVGVIKTRAAARIRYSEIVAELAACGDHDSLVCFLSSIEPELIQFRTELPLFWEGEDDFLGLQQEIDHAHLRADSCQSDWF